MSSRLVARHLALLQGRRALAHPHEVHKLRTLRVAAIVGDLLPEEGVLDLRVLEPVHELTQAAGAGALGLHLAAFVPQRAPVLRPPVLEHNAAAHEGMKMFEQQIERIPQGRDDNLMKRFPLAG